MAGQSLVDAEHLLADRLRQDHPVLAVSGSGLRLQIDDPFARARAAERVVYVDRFPL